MQWVSFSMVLFADIAEVKDTMHFVTLNAWPAMRKKILFEVRLHHQVETPKLRTMHPQARTAKANEATEQQLQTAAQILPNLSP